MKTEELVKRLKDPENSLITFQTPKASGEGWINHNLRNAKGENEDVFKIVYYQKVGIGGGNQTYPLSREEVELIIEKEGHLHLIVE